MALARMRELAAGARRHSPHRATSAPAAPTSARAWSLDALAASGRGSTCASPPTSTRSTSQRALAGAEPGTTLVVVVPRPSRRRKRSPTRAPRSSGSAAADGSIAVTANASSRARIRRAPKCCRCGTGSAGATRCGRPRASAGLPRIGARRVRRVARRRAATWTAHFRDAPLEQNVPALMALLGVWNVNFLGARSARRAALRARAAPAAGLPAAAGDGIQRQARGPRGPRGGLRHRARCSGAPRARRASTRSTSCCTRARRRCRRISSTPSVTRALRQRAGAGRRARLSAPATPGCRRTGAIRATGHRAF